MAQVIVRNLDDEVVARLRDRASKEKKSLEQTLREILTTAARPTSGERLETARRIRIMSPSIAPHSPRAEDLIRLDRDGR